jgi:hypothetical protein
MRSSTQWMALCVLLVLSLERGQPGHDSNHPHQRTLCFTPVPAGERACRRDPMRYSYASITCLNMLQKGKCARGDACASAHSLFEYWLHPDR